MIAEQFSKIMKASGAEHIALPEVMPARPFLEAAGEYLGARMVFLEGTGDVRRCLTPDLTIASCISRINLGSESVPGRYWYDGAVYRESQSQELVVRRHDIGMELLGEDASVDSHLGMCDLWWRLVPSHIQEHLRVYLDDRDMFAMLLESLQVAGPLRRRLLAAYNRPQHLRGLISDGMQPQPSSHLTIAKMAVTLGAEDGRALLHEWVGRESDGVTVARSQDEIVDRLWMLGELEATGGLTDKQQMALKSFLAIECPLTDIGHILRERHVPLGERLPELVAQYKTHVEAMPWAADRIMFRPAHADRLDYYSGFSFQALTRDRTRLFSGGRYDGLVEQLGGEALPAYGGSINLDVLEAGS